MNSVVTKLCNYFFLLFSFPQQDWLLFHWWPRFLFVIYFRSHEKGCNPENYVYSLKISENHCTWWWMDCRYGRRKMRCNNGSWKQNLNSIVCYKVRCPWSNISKTSTGFPKAKNIWNHDGTGRVVLLFSSVLNLMKHEARVFEITSPTKKITLI